MRQFFFFPLKMQFKNCPSNSVINYKFRIPQLHQIKMLFDRLRSLIIDFGFFFRNYYVYLLNTIRLPPLFHILCGFVFFFLCVSNLLTSFTQQIKTMNIVLCKARVINGNHSRCHGLESSASSWMKVNPSHLFCLLNMLAFQQN